MRHMHRFAHIADAHLGAHRDPFMRKLEVEAFRTAMSKCINLNVDFIIFSGDLFHVGIPDLSVVDEGVKEIKSVTDSGIPLYTIYGSHDYTPTATSIVDVLTSAGLLKKVVNWNLVGDKIRLGFTTDQKTGAKITGISARKAGLESKYYEMIDREALEKEGGFKIFTFHSALDEFKPPDLYAMESFPVSLLPKGFGYYAGGHVHDRSENRLPGYEPIVFPGALFPKDARDLERTVRGERRGFYVVSFDDRVRSIEFVEVKVFEGIYLEVDVENMTAEQAQRELLAAVNGPGLGGKLLLLKVQGRLSAGKTSDIDFTAVRQAALDKGALHVELNRHGVTSKEFEAVSWSGEDMQTVESRILKEGAAKIDVGEPALKGDKGYQLSRELLRALRAEPSLNESKRDYDLRMSSQAINLLGLKEDLE
jgi:hypothetical protein